MVELTSDEYRILRFGFYQYADPFRSLERATIVHKLMRVCMDTRLILEDLVRKNVLSESPDKTYVRLTDYGDQLFLYFDSQQKEWHNQEICKVDDAEQDEILIRKGETYRGYSIIRKICLGATKNIVIQDNYVGPDLFKLLSEISQAIEINVLTSDKPYTEKESAELAYAKLKQQNPRIQMKKSNGFHGRYIFIDGQICYEVAHSIKDLGKKESTIKILRCCEDLYTEFKKHWLSAKEV